MVLSWASLNSAHEWVHGHDRFCEVTSALYPLACTPHSLHLCYYIATQKQMPKPHLWMTPPWSPQSFPKDKMITMTFSHSWREPNSNQKSHYWLHIPATSFTQVVPVGFIENFGTEHWVTGCWVCLFFCFLRTITHRLTIWKHSYTSSFFKGNVIFFFFFFSFSTGEARLQIPEFILHLTQSPFSLGFWAVYSMLAICILSLNVRCSKLHSSTVN